MSQVSPPRVPIHTGRAPAAVGPYAQGVRLGDLLFTAGQVGIDPASGEMVAGGVREQTEQVLKNLDAVLAAGGASVADVVKTTVFLTDMGAFADMNEVYGTWFGASAPARSTVAVAALPLGAVVEIEAVARASSPPPEAP